LLDSIIKLTGPDGKLLAFNDDREDPGSRLNTHHADSYVMATLPAEGTYCVHVGDVARGGGEACAYRLRISAPQPDFALRVVPSSVALRSKSATALSVHVIRKDGFTGPIKLGLKTSDPFTHLSVVRLDSPLRVCRIASDIPIMRRLRSWRIANGQDPRLSRWLVHAKADRSSATWIRRLDCRLPPILGDEPARRKDPPTFNSDVPPILQQKCQNCHRSHHIGPFALETFEQARKRASDISLVVTERQMPPWKPAPGVGPKLKHDQSLSPREIAVLEAWSEAGRLTRQD
jgi:hypothetical protein